MTDHFFNELPTRHTRQSGETGRSFAHELLIGERPVSSGARVIWRGMASGW
jgi:hypothetical protein